MKVSDSTQQTLYQAYDLSITKISIGLLDLVEELHSFK
jgi:hypothetical protein